MRQPHLLAWCYAVLALTGCANPLPIPAESIAQPASPSARDVQVIQDLIRFARSPDPETIAAIPFEQEVRLGLSDRLLEGRTSEELAEPKAWVLSSEGFRAHVGPFSALDLLGRADAIIISVGPHPNCASPPAPPPAPVADLRRVSVQPRDNESCHQWWTVDLFMTPGGSVAAVTLDLWEP